MKSTVYLQYTASSRVYSVRPLLVTMTLNGKEVVMEIDTGSAVTNHLQDYCN